jgi:hypothetical protein
MLLRGLEAWAVVAQIVQIQAVGDVPIPLLPRQLDQVVVQLGLAVVAAVGRVGEVIRVL